MINYDFLDIADTEINNSVTDAKAASYSINDGLTEAASNFDYSGFYDTQPVKVLPTPVIIDYRIVARTNPFTTHTGNHRTRILKLRRHIVALRTRANRYYNVNGKAA